MQTNLWEIFFYLIPHPLLVLTVEKETSFYYMMAEERKQVESTSTRLIYSCSSILKYKRADVLAKNMPKFALTAEH